VTSTACEGTLTNPKTIKNKSEEYGRHLLCLFSSLKHCGQYSSMVSSAISENLKMSQTYRWMPSMGPFFVSEMA